MKRHEKLAVDALQPGMIVAQAVLDENARVLIAAGATLSEVTIASLVRREVRTVVVATEVEEDPATQEARRTSQVKQLDHLFRNAGNSAEVQALYRAVLDFRLEQGL